MSDDHLILFFFVRQTRFSQFSKHQVLFSHDELSFRLTSFILRNNQKTIFGSFFVGNMMLTSSYSL